MVDEILVHHPQYMMPCQKQEAMFFFGTIYQIMMLLNIGHFIAISNIERQGIMRPTKESIRCRVYLHTFVCMKVCEWKDITCEILLSAISLYEFSF